MKRVIYPILFVVLLLACKERKPLVIDPICENIRFPEVIEGTLDSNFYTSKKIELTEDSTFIGMWHETEGALDYIRLIYSKNNRCYMKGYKFHLFLGESDLRLSYIREKKY